MKVGWEVVKGGWERRGQNSDTSVSEIIHTFQTIILNYRFKNVQYCQFKVYDVNKNEFSQ